jgi:hypothetical protein
MTKRPVIFRPQAGFHLKSGIIGLSDSQGCRSEGKINGTNGKEDVLSLVAITGLGQQRSNVR